MAEQDLTVAKLAGALAAGVDEKLFARAASLREERFGNTIHLCGVINAKSGRCPEDCAFCAQSAHARTAAPAYPLLDEDQLFAAGEKAEARALNCFGIVLAGRGLTNGKEIERLARLFRRFAKAGFKFRRGLSAGLIRRDDLLRLRDAGLERFHHNLESARSFYPQVCSTRRYEQNVEALLTAREAGLELCCGGIFGMGETPAQRLELALELKALGIKSAPLNFLVPVPGTRLAGRAELTPEICLGIIAAFRLLLPGADLHLCGGRLQHLAAVSGKMFAAGATGLMTGDYLTTPGFTHDDDLRLLFRLGLTPRPRG